MQAKVEFFKHECQSYNDYKKWINDAERKIEEIREDASSISSPTIKPVVYENARDSSAGERILIGGISEIMVQEQIKKMWQTRIDFVDNLLSQMPMLGRDIVTELYIKGTHYVKVALKFNFSTNYVYTKADAYIAKVMNKV